MDLSGFKNTNVDLLVGLVNTELRNESDSLEDLCKTHDIEITELLDYLAEGNYEFRPEQQQFK